MNALLTAFFVFLAVLVGALLPLQASINTTLLEPLENPIAPACLSIIIGAICLMLVWPYDPRPKKTVKEILERGPEDHKTLWERLKSTEKYLFLLPGSFGVYYVLLSILIAKQIGFSLFFIAVVAGQLVGAAVIDHFGLFGMHVKKLTRFRLASMVFVFIGSVLSVIEKIIDASAKSTTNADEEHLPAWKQILFIILSILSGVGLTLQVSMNVLLTKRLGSLAHRVSSWSIFWSAIELIILCGLSFAISSIKNINFAGFREISAWQYTGGPMGALYLFCSVLLGPRLGLSLFMVLVVAGQLLCSLLIDSFGWIGGKVIEPTALRLVGVFIVFFSVVAFRFEDRIKARLYKKKSAPKDTTNNEPSTSSGEDVAQSGPVVANDIESLSPPMPISRSNHIAVGSPVLATSAPMISSKDEVNVQEANHEIVHLTDQTLQKHNEENRPGMTDTPMVQPEHHVDIIAGIEIQPEDESIVDAGGEIPNIVT